MGNSICAISCGDREAPGTMRSQTEQGGDTGPQTQTEWLSVHSTVIMAAPGGSSYALRDEVNDKRAGEGKVC